MPTDEQRKSPTDSNKVVKLRDGSVRSEIDLRSYRLSAVQKAAYKLAARCTIVFGSAEATSLPITFLFPRPTSETETSDIVRLFFQVLLDQELREQVGEETKPLRALILAHAFSKTDLIRRE